jgi:hypothetical protein
MDAGRWCAILVTGHPDTLAGGTTAAYIVRRNTRAKGGSGSKKCRDAEVRTRKE